MLTSSSNLLPLLCAFPFELMSECEAMTAWWPELSYCHQPRLLMAYLGRTAWHGECVCTLLGRPFCGPLSVRRGQWQRCAQPSTNHLALNPFRRQLSALPPSVDWPESTWKEPHIIIYKGELEREHRKGPAGRPTPRWFLSCWLLQPVTLTLAPAPQTSLGVITESLPLPGA